MFPPNTPTIGEIVLFQMCVADDVQLLPAVVVAIDYNGCPNLRVLTNDDQSPLFVQQALHADRSLAIDRTWSRRP